MNKAIQVILTILGVYIFIQAFISLAGFLGISFNEYINYLLWFVALLLFWVFLPKDVGGEFFK